MSVIWGDRNGERCGGCRDLGPHTLNSACEYGERPSEPADHKIVADSRGSTDDAIRDVYNRANQKADWAHHHSAGLRAVAAVAWDAAVAAMQYEDGTPVEIVVRVNPFRIAESHVSEGRGPLMDYPRCDAVEPSSGARCQIHRDAEHELHEHRTGGGAGWVWPNVAETITIPRPHVPFGPKHVSTEEADAAYLREVVRKIDQGTNIMLGGSNVTATVRKLLADAAAALDPQPDDSKVDHG